MTFPQKQLLCRFSDSKRYADHIEYIKCNVTLLDNRIFVFANEDRLSEIYLTFHIDKSSSSSCRVANTISLHRKKHTNTLYTLNAMNRLIEDENGGKLDKNFQLNWEYYKNSIILINDPGVRIVPLRLFSIVNF